MWFACSTQSGLAVATIKAVSGEPSASSSSSVGCQAGRWARRVDHSIPAVSPRHPKKFSLPSMVRSLMTPTVVAHPLAFQGSSGVQMPPSGSFHGRLVAVIHSADKFKIMFAITCCSSGQGVRKLHQEKKTGCERSHTTRNRLEEKDFTRKIKEEKMIHFLVLNFESNQTTIFLFDILFVSNLYSIFLRQSFYFFIHKFCLRSCV